MPAPTQPPKDFFDAINWQPTPQTPLSQTTAQASAPVPTQPIISEIEKGNPEQIAGAANQLERVKGFMPSGKSIETTIPVQQKNQSPAAKQIIDQTQAAKVVPPVAIVQTVNPSAINPSAINPSAINPSAVQTIGSTAQAASPITKTQADEMSPVAKTVGHTGPEGELPTGPVASTFMNTPAPNPAMPEFWQNLEKLITSNLKQGTSFGSGGGGGGLIRTIGRALEAAGAGAQGRAPAYLEQERMQKELEMKQAELQSSRQNLVYAQEMENKRAQAAQDAASARQDATNKAENARQKEMIAANSKNKDDIIAADNARNEATIAAENARAKENNAAEINKQIQEQNFRITHPYLYGQGGAPIR